MTTHGSATLREEAPHVTETTQITISNALRRRAQAVINDTSIDPQWRNIVRYALEINDPLLPDLVRRADAGETIIDFSETSETNEKCFRSRKDRSTDRDNLCSWWCKSCGRTVRADGNGSKFDGTQSTCTRGEALCLYTLR